MIQRSIRHAACAAAFVALAVPAGAADKVKEGGFSSKAGKATGPMLTRAQLRDCLSLYDRRQADSDAVGKERAAIEAEKADLLREGEAIKEALAALDRTSQEAVDRYNERALARDKRIDAFELRTAEYNKRAEATQALNAQFAAGCENRRFDEADEVAIRKGK